MRRVALPRRAGVRVDRACKRTTRVISLLGLLALVWTGAGSLGLTTKAEAKTPGKTYCFNRICHRVKTLSETRREIGINRVVQASHYDDCRRDRFNPCGLTSSGERFRANAADNAASPVYPDGTRLMVRNPSNGKTLVVRINNAGPYHGRRLLDLSRAAAVKLGFAHRGVARLQVRVLSAPTRREARYSRNRRYAPVPGYVGRFQSMTAALWRVPRKHGGWGGNPASTMARLAMNEERFDPGWLTTREMRKTAWRLRKEERRNPSRFVVQASNDIPLPKAKAEVEANTQATRIANLEYGIDKAGRTHVPAAAPSSVLVAALPERRPERAAPAVKLRKTVVLANKRSPRVKRNKLIAAKKKQRLIRLAELKRKKAIAKNSKKAVGGKKRLAKKQQTKKQLAQLKKPVRSKRQKLNNKKRIRVASLSKKKTPARKSPVRAKQTPAANAKKPVRRVTVQKLKTAYVTTAQKATVGKSKLPAAAKKKPRPAPRVARSNWRVGVLRGGREL